jgi:isochorismate hydrolase
VRKAVAIPDIGSYPMPAEASLPGNLVDWRADPARAALLLHDMQAYFLAPYRRDGLPLTDLMTNTRRLRGRAAALGMPVVYTAQPGAMDHEQRGLLDDFWGPGMSADDADTRIADELAPAAADVVLTKWRYSAFHRSQLHQILQRSGRDQLIVTGVYANVGCLATAVDAFSRDIQPFFVADAVADFSAGSHRLALDYAARACACVVSTEQLLGMLARGGDGVREPGAQDRATFFIRVDTPIAADLDVVFGYVSDLSRAGEWSPECLGGDWVSGPPGALGSVFRGRNHREPSVVPWAPVVRGEWTTQSQVVESRRPRTFAWAMRDSSGRPQDSVWSFQTRPAPGGCVLTHGFRMGDPTEGMREIFSRAGQDGEQKFVVDWSVKLEADMRQSLARIKAVLESADGRGDAR